MIQMKQPYVITPPHLKEREEKNNRIIESLRLDNTSKIIKSNCPPTTNTAH